MKRMIWILLGLLGFVAIAFAVLLFVTHTPPEVRATITDDTSLPRLRGADVMLHGRIIGPEDAPLTIVLHGGPGNDHRSLLGLEKLTDSHRILFYDQRGAGLSERVTPEQLDIAHHLADLDQLALSCIIVVAMTCVWKKNLPSSAKKWGFLGIENGGASIIAKR